MLGPNATWGDARKIYEKSLQTPDLWFEDNILSDPEVREATKDKPDAELIAKPGVMLSLGPTPDPEDGLGERVEFSILVDGDRVELLTRADFEDGSLEFRNDGDWVLVGPEDDVPALEKLPFTRVTGEAVAIFDKYEDDPKASHFSEVLLDE